MTNWKLALRNAHPEINELITLLFVTKETFIIAGGKLKTFRDLVKQYHAEA